MHLCFIRVRGLQHVGDSRPACYCRIVPPLKYDLTGQVFGLLTALHHVSSGNWLVRCECGVEKVVMGQNLRVNGLKSCGCAKRVPQGFVAGATGAAHLRWQGDAVRYATAHRRITSKRGPAREHPCISCGGEAHSWAYRGGSSKELTETVGANHLFKAEGALLRYSPDPADYDPMCWACHVKKDLAERR